MFQKVTGSFSFQVCRKLQSADSSATLITLAGPAVRIPIKFIEKKPLTADTKRFRFALPSADHSLGIPIGNFIQLTVTVDGKQETRSYTPISTNEDRGHIDLAIKIYPPTIQNPRGGIVTQYLDQLKKGDEVLMSGPLGLLRYNGHGTFLISSGRFSLGTAKTFMELGMLCGGSGVTAMIPILRTMLKEDDEKPQCSLVYSNVTDRDIIMQDELSSLSSKHRKRLKVWYTVERPTKTNWKYGVGRINDKVIQTFMPVPAAGVLVLVCGPRPMVAACKALLLDLHYTNEMIFIFSNPP